VPDYRCVKEQKNSCIIITARTQVGVFLLPFPQRLASCKSQFLVALPWVNSCNVFLTLLFVVWDNLSYAEYCFFFDRATAHSGPGPPHYWGFTITFRHTSLGRAPLDESSARWEIPNWHHTTLTQHRYPCPLSGFEPAIPKTDRPHNHPWDKGATGICAEYLWVVSNDFITRSVS
jgi:hypothetical protein